MVLKVVNQLNPLVVAIPSHRGRWPVQRNDSSIRQKLSSSHSPAGAMRLLSLAAVVKRSQVSFGIFSLSASPRQKLVRRASAGDHVNSRKAFAMLLHLLFAEQLRAQRSFFTVGLCLPNGLTQALADVKEVPVRLPSSQQVPPSSYMCEYLRQERRCERAK
jgi:hypothetical protein